VACDSQGDAALRRSAALSQALLWYQWIRPALQTDHSQTAPGGYAQRCHGIRDRRSGTSQKTATATYSATATNGATRAAGMLMAEMIAETLPFRSLPAAAASAGDCPSHATNARPRAPASPAGQSR
jgi:hypothetical protein